MNELMSRLAKKKNLVAAGMVLFLTAVVPACDILEDCGQCELVTIDAEGNTSRSTPMLYCGDDLEEKLNSSPVTVNGVTTYWDCY